MWKRFSLELLKTVDLYSRNAFPKRCRQIFLQTASTQIRLSSSSSDHSNIKIKQAPIEPEGPPTPPEGSYFIKRMPQKKKEAQDETFSIKKVEKILKELEEEYDFNDDRPVPDMINPYEEAPKRCLMCQYNVKLDYKNSRLLSQFVSPYSGRVYGRKITGLCIPMQREISRLIRQSRDFGFMPYTYKKSEYLKDPKLFDPFAPTN